MDTQSSKEHSIGNESNASNRVVRPNLAAMQLQLLPSDVLRDVLSRLSLKDVVRMSILSPEWRQLKICHPDLVFTKDTFSNCTTENTEHREHMTFDELMEFKAKKLERLSRQFIKNVDNVLRPLWYTPTATTTTLEKFAVKFGLRKKHRYHIDRWVSFSALSKAKDIALDFASDDEICSGSKYDKYNYALPLSNFTGPNGSCVRSLYLGNIHLELPPSFCGITNLKKLTLNAVSINGDDLQCMLLRCALLENLSIDWCSSLSTLRIPQELCRLQDLHVRYTHLEIELHASNLKTFEFDDYVQQVLLNQCLKLSEATFVSNMRAGEFDEYGFDFTFTELPPGLPHVHKLFLLLNVDQVLRFSENQSRFINLRHLNMNLEIFFYPPDNSWAVGFVNLLELAPLLEELELHLGRDRFCPSAIRTATAMQGPLHRHLKNVYMTGFCEVLGLAELALYILGNSTALKSMVVDPAAYSDPWNDDIYSVSKGGSSEECQDLINQKRMFAENNLYREEFCHILTIL
ncbi:unnamed protein product [Alopecurus aequalis]